jgi:hypothetical protein
MTTTTTTIDEIGAEETTEDQTGRMRMITRTDAQGTRTKKKMMMATTIDEEGTAAGV